MSSNIILPFAKNFSYVLLVLAKIAFLIFAIFIDREISRSRRFFTFERIFKNLHRHYKLTSPNSSNCTISTVNLSKLPVFSLGCTFKFSVLTCIWRHCGRMSHFLRTARSISSLSLVVFLKMVQCYRTEFTKRMKSLLSTSHRLTAENKWHHTTVL